MDRFGTTKMTTPIRLGALSLGLIASGAFAATSVDLLDSDDNDITYFYESRLPGEGAPVEDRHFIRWSRARCA